MQISSKQNKMFYLFIFCDICSPKGRDNNDDYHRQIFYDKSNIYVTFY